MTLDYQAAWDLYYLLADRRHKEGLVFDEVKQIVDAAVKGTPMHYCRHHRSLRFDMEAYCEYAALGAGGRRCKLVEGVFIPIDEERE